MPNEYDVGDIIRCTGTFTDINGNLLDPTSVFVIVKDPAGTETTWQYLVVPLDLKRLSLGVFYIDVELDDSVNWYYRFYSTGTGQAAAEEQVWVKVSHFS